MPRSYKFLLLAIAAGLIMAAPAFACLATPAAEKAAADPWDRGNIDKMPYPKGEEGPMAPIMGGEGVEGGIPHASEMAGPKFPNDTCTQTDMDWCSEGVDPGGVTR